MFTFKKEKRETGLAAVGRPHPNTTIKYRKKCVGTIYAPYWASKDNLWHVRLMIVCDEGPGWKWVTLKQKFDDEPAARAYLNENEDRILKLNLHSHEDDE